MKVGDILRKKTARVATVRMNETVAIAAQLMRTSNISALVVKDVVRTEGNTAVGMFTERDVVRAIAEHGAAGVNLKVSQLISVQQLVSCSSIGHARTCAASDEHESHPAFARDRQLQPDRRRQHPRHLDRVRRSRSTPSDRSPEKLIPVQHDQPALSHRSKPNADRCSKFQITLIRTLVGKIP